MTLDKDLAELLDRKQRQQNMNDILNALNPSQIEFNTMILGFTDIIQSVFYNYLSSQCKSNQDKNEMDKRINATVNEIMDVLNKRSLSNPEDMVILSTIMIEAIAKALVRQSQTGEMRIAKKLSNLQKTTR